jgi:lipoxygenase homology domain-containing protein 1
VRNVVVSHDNSGWFPGWYLVKVIVKDLAKQVTYECGCDRWLAIDEDDGQIYRTLRAVRR